MAIFNRDKYVKLRNKANAKYILRRDPRITTDFHSMVKLSFHYKDGRPDPSGLIVARMMALSMLLLDEKPIVAINHVTDALVNGVIWVEDGLLNTTVMVRTCIGDMVGQQPYISSELLEEGHFRGLLEHLNYKSEVIHGSSEMAFDRIMTDLVKA